MKTEALEILQRFGIVLDSKTSDKTIERLMYIAGFLPSLSQRYWYVYDMATYDKFVALMRGLDED